MTPQFQSFVRWLLNAISGAVLSYTATRSPAAQGVGAFLANLITGPDCIAAGVLVATWLWGHIYHAPASPTPSSNGTASKLPLIFLVASLALPLAAFTGCASLDPNARAVVVRAEQSEAVANATLDAAIHIDASNREFFKTNAAPFHAFCEWLRTPVLMPPLTTPQPRGVAMIRSLDAVKETYKRTNTTNDYAILISSLATVEAVTSQAQNWIANLNNK